MILKAALGYVASSYVRDRMLRPRAMGQLARKAADRRRKPLLFVHDNGVAHHLMGCPVRAEVQTGLAFPIRTPNKAFGALLAVGVLEKAKRPAVVLREWHRVADAVFVVVPSWWSPHTWLDPSVRWLIDPGLSRAVPLWTARSRACLLDVSDSRYGTPSCAPTKTTTASTRLSSSAPKPVPNLQTMTAETSSQSPSSLWTAAETAEAGTEEPEGFDFPSLPLVSAQSPSEDSPASRPIDSWNFAKEIMVISSEEFDES